MILCSLCSFKDLKDFKLYCTQCVLPVWLEYKIFCGGFPNPNRITNLRNVKSVFTPYKI